MHQHFQFFGQGLTGNAQHHGQGFLRHAHPGAGIHRHGGVPPRQRKQSPGNAGARGAQHGVFHQPVQRTHPAAQQGPQCAGECRAAHQPLKRWRTDHQYGAGLNRRDIVGAWQAVQQRRFAKPVARLHDGQNALTSVLTQRGDFERALNDPEKAGAHVLLAVQHVARAQGHHFAGIHQRLAIGQGQGTQRGFNVHIPSLRDKVSAEEWQLRIDLAACYRLVALYGWSDLVFTHISARIPGPEHHFLINPYGLMFDEITASSLVKVDQQCNKLHDSPFPVNPAGFVIHSAVHEVREDAGCVLHTHTRAGVAVSAQQCGILPISQQSTFVLASLAYHDYEGVAFRPDEKPRLQADLGTANFLMLRNHGLLTVGKSIADAFLSMYTFEATCKIQIDAQAGGALTEVNPLIVKGVSEAMRVQTGGMGGAFAWPALIRKLDRIDTSYQT